MKRIFAFILAVILLMAMCVPVFAEENEDSGLTEDSSDVSTTTDRTYSYEVYQIFTGTYDEETNTLSNIKWGVNGKGSEGELVDSDTLSVLTALYETYSTIAGEFEVLTFISQSI